MIPAIAELAQRVQWVCWRLEKRGARATKIPIQTTGAPASSTDPRTWCSYQEARRAVDCGLGEGIGIVMTDSDPFVGVDLDSCVENIAANQNLSIAAWAKCIVDQLGSYTEISPSGTGMRIFVRAELPPHGRKRGSFEIYESRRFLTITEHHLPGTRTTIEDRHDEVLDLHREIFSVRENPASVADLAYTSTYTGELPARVSALRISRVRDLLELPASSLGYPSESEADLALAGSLARLYLPAEVLDATLRWRRARVGGRWKDDQYFRRTVARALGDSR